MKKHFYTVLFILLSIFFGADQIRADIPPRPSPPKLVNDLGEVLSQQQEEALEYKLRYFNDTTSNQILVVTLPTLNDYDPASVAFEIGEKWQVGQKDFDNGIVVLVKPKYTQSDRGDVFIAVGYGLEGAIPDAITKRIIENEMLPYFRNNDYYNGIDKATEVLMALAAGELSKEGYNKSMESNGLSVFLPIIIFILVFILIRVSNARSYSIGTGNSFWTALWMGSALSGGRSHSGSWSDFTGGSSGFGGGSSSSGFGGGFSGFGGGSFGGGGAGGSW